MSEVFTNSGQSDNIIAGPAPVLQGLFIPGMDNPQFVDGFGIVTPWGGGSTTRRYGDYGITPDRDTQLTDLASAFIPAEGGGLSYGVQGEPGQQGIQGPRGLPGIITILGLNLPPAFQQNTNFLTALPHNIDQINDLGTAVGKLIYTDTYTTVGGQDPTGVDLASGTTDGDTLPDYGTWEEREITFDVGIELSYVVADSTKQGGQSTLRSWYQSFVPISTFTLDGLEINIDSVPSGTAKSSLYFYNADVDGKPTGSPLGGGSVGFLNTANTGWQGDLTLSNSITLTAGNRYCFRLGGFGTSGEYHFDFDSGDSYGDGTCWYWDGSDYVAQNGDINFKIYGTGSSGIELTSGTKYAIVVRAAASDLMWSVRIDNPYVNGDLYESSDSGSSWVLETDDDCWFKTKANGVEKDDGSFSPDGFNRAESASDWNAQTFIASSTYTISSVILKLAKWSGTTPGTVKVSIRATNPPSYSEATWAESALTSAGRAILDDADAPAQATTLGLGTGDSPEFTGLTLSGLTATRLVQSGSALASVADLTAWVAGTANQITSSSGGDGTLTLSIPNPFAVPGKVTAGSFASPTDVTNTREYGMELHYSGNDYNVTGIRSRARLKTTDTTATAQGALLQAANEDGINAGVLQGALIEAIGKSDGNAATIAVMRGALVNTEWGDYDTVTNLKTLHIRNHSRNAAGAGSFGTGYGIYIENEAVGGNGQAYDAGIYFKGTNLSAGNKAFTYGIDFSGGTYGSADIKLSDGSVINDANGRYGFGTATPVTTLEIPGSTTNSSAKFGAFEIQSYAVNNAWMGENFYYNGGAFKHRAEGYSTMLYFRLGKLIIQTADTGVADSLATMVVRFVCDRDGDFAIGGDITSHTNFNGALLVGQSNKLGINEPIPETLTEWTHANPDMTWHGETHSNDDGATAGKHIWKREDGAGTETACFQFEASHDGVVANDQLGKGVWSVNTGAGLVQALEIGSDLAAAFAGAVSAGSFTGLVIGTDVQAHGDVLDHLNTLGQVGADSEFLVGTGAGVLDWEAQQTALNSITAVSGATNEHVLTKDTATGNAIFKVAAAVSGFSSKCSVYLGNNQSINTSTLTTVQFDTENYDIDGEFDNITNYRFTATSTGYYHISTAVKYAELNDGIFHTIYVRVDGAVVARAGKSTAKNLASPSATIAKDLYLTAGQYVDVQAYHVHGLARNILANNEYTFLTIHRFA